MAKSDIEVDIDKTNGWIKQNYGQYKAYLRSSQWKEKRQLILDRDQCCSTCGSIDGLQVHHRTYDTLFNEPLEDLITLCQRCHFKDDDQHGEHPEYGEYEVDVMKGCKFTKLYQTKDPNFSKDSYYKYWFKICCSLNKDTNVIYNGKYKVRLIGELQSFCGGSNATITKFFKECKEKGLIATFGIMGKKEFVVNPRYALNGKRIPKLLYMLFDNDDETE